MENSLSCDFSKTSNHSSISSSDAESFVFVQSHNNSMESSSSHSRRSTASSSGGDILARGVCLPSASIGSRQCSSSATCSSEPSSLKYGFQNIKPLREDEKDLLAKIKKLVVENEQLKTTLKEHNETLQTYISDLTMWQRKFVEGNNKHKNELNNAHHKILELETDSQVYKEMLEKRSSQLRKNPEAVQKLAKDLKTKFQEQYETVRKLLKEVKEFENTTLHGEPMESISHSDLKASLLQLEYSMKECIEHTFIQPNIMVDSWKDQTHEIIYLKERNQNLKLEIQEKDQTIEEFKGEEIENRKKALEYGKMQSENDKLKKANQYLHIKVRDLEQSPPSVEFGHGPPAEQAQNQMIEELKKRLKILQDKFDEIITDNERLISENYVADQKLKEIECKDNDKDAKQQADDHQLRAQYEIAIRTLTEELNCAKEELAKRTEEFVAKETEVEILKTKLEEKTIQEEELLKSTTVDLPQIEDLKKQLDMFKRRETKDADKINDLMTDKDKLKEEHVKLTQDLEDQHATTQQLQGQIASLCEVKSSSVEEEKKVKENLQQLAEKNNKNVEELQRQHCEDAENLEKIRQENHQLKQELDDIEGLQERNNMLEENMQQLLKENQELDAKAQELNDAKERQLELDKSLLAKDEYLRNAMREITEFEQLRISDGENMQRLQDQLAASIQALEYERNQYVNSQQAFGEARQKLEVYEKSHCKLVKDYNDLWNQFSAKIAAQEKISKESEMVIETLRAKVVHMEELLNTTMGENDILQKHKQGLEDQLRKVNDQSRRLQDDMETIPILKEQVQIYETDFKAEREAREKQQADILHLREQLQHFQLENRRLHEEVDTHGRNQMLEMQRRHGTGTIHGPTSSHQVQWQNTAHPSSYSSQDASSSYPAYTNNQYTMYARGKTSVSDGKQDGQGRQAKVGNAAGQEPDQPVQRTCPKCRHVFPDLDTLQIHVMECIDD